MGLGEFVTPTAEEWIDALGVVPRPEDDDGDVSRALLTFNAADKVDLSFAIGGNSVRLRWLRGEDLLLDMTREGARRIRVESGRGQASIRVEFDSDGFRGELTIQMLPETRIKDTMLFA